MPVTITINGEDAEHALRELRGLSGGLLVEGATSPVDRALSDNAETVTSGLQTGVATGSAPTAEKPARRGRAQKVTDAVIVEEPKQIVEPEATAPAAEEKQSEPEPKPEPKELTLDDVRNAANDYITKFTLAAAQIDLMPCLKAATGVEKISELAGKDQATLQKAVDAFKQAAVADTRYGQSA